MGLFSISFTLEHTLVVFCVGVTMATFLRQMERDCGMKAGEAHTHRANVLWLPTHTSLSSSQPYVTACCAQRGQVSEWFAQEVLQNQITNTFILLLTHAVKAGETMSGVKCANLLSVL